VRTLLKSHGVSVSGQDLWRCDEGETLWGRVRGTVNGTVLALDGP
jgi:hypothetical protein